MRQFAKTTCQKHRKLLPTLVNSRKKGFFFVVVVVVFVCFNGSLVIKKNKEIQVGTPDVTLHL